MHLKTLTRWGVPCRTDPSARPPQPMGPGQQLSPGHHQELVDLLVYEGVVCLPHLGLQLGLVATILLAYKEETAVKPTRLEEARAPRDALGAKSLSAPAVPRRTGLWSWMPSEGGGTAASEDQTHG